MNGPLKGLSPLAIGKTEPSQKQIVTTLKFCKELLPRQGNYLETLVLNGMCEPIPEMSGYLNYMGQIVKSILPSTALSQIDTKTGKAVQLLDLNDRRIIYPPFTINCNGRYVQTDLSTTIINLSPSPREWKKSTERLKQLLEPYGFIIQLYEKDEMTYETETQTDSC